MEEVEEEEVEIHQILSVCCSDTRTLNKGHYFAACCSDTRTLNKGHYCKILSTLFSYFYRLMLFYTA